MSSEAMSGGNATSLSGLGRTGGVYVPPFKLAQMRQALGGGQDQQTKNSAEAQKLSWEALRKSLNGLINKLNVSNIKNIVPELFQENLVRGRGLFARAIMKAQLASPGFTHIYAALIAIINTKLPENGELILKRVISGFKRAYKRRDKLVATALAKFVAHLVNHQVAHELLALQVLTVLLQDPTDDSVEIAVNFVKEVGQVLEELSPQGLHAIFERFRGILHEGDIDKRVQYTIEGLFAIRKSGFADYPAIPKDLDLVEREDQITFELGLDDEVDREEMLDVFRFDPQFEENERLWEEIKRDILGSDSDEEEQEGNGGAYHEDGGEGEGEDGEQQLAVVPADSGKIIDLTEQDLVNLRRTIYLTIMSSASFEECAHKLLKLKIPDGYESELCNMLVQCCSNERSYLRYYGLLAQRLCMLHRKYQDAFDQAFITQYASIHRLETNKLRNVAKIFAHVLATDALPWTCLECIRINEDETTSSSRIFIKILMQELSEALGLNTLRERFSDPYMQQVFSGLFPVDNLRNTRFAINFFTSIGLGGLTDGLREHLKNAPKLLELQMQAQQRLLAEQRAAAAAAESSDSSDSSSGSDSDSSSDSSSSDSDSDSDDSSVSTSSSGSSSSSYSSSGSSTSDSSTSSDSSSSSSEDSRYRSRRSSHRRDGRGEGRGQGEDREKTSKLDTAKGKTKSDSRGADDGGNRRKRGRSASNSSAGSKGGRGADSNRSSGRTRERSADSRDRRDSQERRQRRRTGSSRSPSGGGDRDRGSRRGERSSHRDRR